MVDDIDEEFIDEDFDEFDNYDDGSEIEMLTSILKSASKSANNLTNLIVENNHRSSVAMSSEDIYDIFRNSFIVALTTISPSHTE